SPHVPALRPARPRSAPLVPYTTLFRSCTRRRAHLPRRRGGGGAARDGARGIWWPVARISRSQRGNFRHLPARAGVHLPRAVGPRSEEHTSELQSRGELACRLLLGKKHT